MDFPLSKVWYEQFYPELESKLGYSSEADALARDQLETLLKEKRTESYDLRILSDLFENRTVFVFGAGPSLVQDISGLKALLDLNSFPAIAADGAIDALVQSGIHPLICVSDLDSASEKNLVEQSKERILVVHAHRDNTDLLDSLVPKMGPHVFGTTQVEPNRFISNTGGLTDGDRSCYLASAFNPKVVILSGMDFGLREGDYSKDRYNVKVSQDRRTKLEIGLKSLEFLITKSPGSTFINVTAEGEEIKKASKKTYEDLIKDFS